MKITVFDMYMEAAWDLHQMSKPDCAFEKLHCAVLELAKELREVKDLAHHANNTASCLANGIQPD